MAEDIVGNVKRVVGPVVEARRVQRIEMLELVLVGEFRLIGEVVRIQGDSAWIQVYEDTTGLRPGAPIWSRGEPLSVELGPGLVGGIYDGVQRPLDALRASTGDFISKGAQVPALDRGRKWHFVPSAEAPAPITGGAILGSVRETALIEHKIMVPPHLGGNLLDVVPEGDYTVDDTVARIGTAEGLWKSPSSIAGRCASPSLYRQVAALGTADYRATGDRHLVPGGRGGVVVVPGGFGTGKTMVQHALASGVTPISSCISDAANGQ